VRCVTDKVEQSWYLRRFAKEAIETYPSIARMSQSITGRRRMGSPATVNGYIQGIDRFLEFIGYGDPETALEAIVAGRVDVEDEMDRQDTGFIDVMLDKYANKTVHTYCYAVKKWLEVNGVTLDWSRVETPTTSVSRNEDRAPTPKELRTIISCGSQLKDRVGTLILASSGLRIGTLLGLKWGDVDLDYPDVARITVKRAQGRKFSKRSRRGGQTKMYVTWITPEAKEALVDYVHIREVSGETITPDSPLIMGRQGHMTVSGYEKRWYNMLAKAGLDQKSHSQYVLHLHVLRKYFRTHCIGVDSAFREHWMGHKGGYLDESYFKAEERRHLEEYRKAIPHLSVYSRELEELRQEMQFKSENLEDKMKGIRAIVNNTI